MKRLLGIALLLSTTFTVSAQTPPPDLLNYQGVLRDSAGAPVSGTVDIVFRLFDAASAGNEILVDAHDPVGYVFRHGHGDLFEPERSIAWLTDLGYATELVRERIRLADILVLESNHDLDMLNADTRRPWSVKQRITGRHGHLSNQAARDILTECANPTWKHVYLAHLSRDCNSLEAVDRTFADIRASSAQTYSLETVAPDGPGTAVLELD